MEPIVWLDEAGPFGVCVGLRADLGDDPSSWGRPPALYPAEIEAAAAFGGLRRVEWLLGRLALRRALARLGVPTAGPLLAGPRGAPALPPGVSGSLSHKRVGRVVWAVALVAPAEEGALGVDLEVDAPGPPDVLTFALREAAGKALDPGLGRFIALDEVDVILRADGTAELSWRDPPPQGCPPVLLRWERRDRFVLALGRIPATSTSRQGS